MNDDVDVEIEQPHVHHRPSGYRWLDLALPLAALFVSFVSIFIAWHHGKVMQELVHQNEKLVEANSLPYVQIDGSNGNGRVTFNATNEGVGPAEDHDGGDFRRPPSDLDVAAVGRRLLRQGRLFRPVRVDASRTDGSVGRHGGVHRFREGRE